MTHSNTRRRLMRGLLGALAAVPLALAGGVTASAAQPSGSSADAPAPLASFNFDTPASSGAYTDAATGAKAVVHGTENLVASQAGQGKAAKISSGFWLDLTDKDGASPLKGHSAVTISYDSKPDVTNNIGWTIYGVQSADFNPAGQETYLGVMDKAGSVRVERYANGRNGDAGTIEQSTNTGTNWKHVDLVIDGTTAKLYVNKVLLATNTKGATLEQMLTSTGGILRVGRANWGSGEYYSGLIDNVRIYGSALTDRQLGLVAPTALTISGTGVADHALTTQEGSAFGLTAAYTPATGVLQGVKWSSSDPSVVSSRGDGSFTALKAGTARLTVTSTVDPSVSDTITVTVTKNSVKADDPYGYVMVHFKEDSAGYAEKIYLDISRGDNAEQWDPLNGGEPILTNKESTTGVRDPFIAKDPTTGTFYLLATDLRVFGGDNAQWGTWMDKYSTKLHVWSTKDFIHFSKMGTLETTAGSDGVAQNELTDTKTGSKITDPGMAWAPEATWVPDFYDLNDDGKANNSAQGGAFVLYWSANPSVDGARRHNTVMWGYTSDFTQKTFHFGGVFVNTGGYTIDTTMLQRTIGTNADGSAKLRTYRVTKDNSFGKGIYMETTDSQDWWNPKDTVWKTTQTKIGAAYAGGNAGGVEGPASFTDHSSPNRWYLYVDVIPSIGYKPMVSTDLDGTTPWVQLSSPDFSMAAHTKHGGIVSLTKAQYDAIRKADALKSDNKDLTAGDVTVPVGATAPQVEEKLPTSQKVTLAYGYGTSELPVKWDLSSLDTSKEGETTVTGTVDTIGANKNHWSYTDSTGATKTDLDDLENTTPNADNSWKQSGGMDGGENRRLYSSTAITVTAKVVVAGTQKPDQPDQPDQPGKGGQTGGQSGNKGGATTPGKPASGSTAKTGSASASAKGRQSALASTGSAVIGIAAAAAVLAGLGSAVVLLRRRRG